MCNSSGLLKFQVVVWCLVLFHGLGTCSAIQELWRWQEDARRFEEPYLVGCAQFVHVALRAIAGCLDVLETDPGKPNTVGKRCRRVSHIERP